MRKRIQRILCLVLSLTAAVGLMLVRDSAAWFKTRTGTPIGQAINATTMDFEFIGELDSGLLYPAENNNAAAPFVITGKNLIEGYTETVGGTTTRYVKLTGINHSTTPTEVRFKIFYTHPSTGATLVYGEDPDSLMSATAASGWTEDNSNNEFYFTRHLDAVAAANASTGVKFDLLTDLSFDNDAVNSANISSFSTGSDGKIVIAIQARQSGNMIWEDVGSITSSSSFVASALAS